MALRHLLNVESGVNDGLALPFVMVFLAVAAGSDDLHLGELALELGLGVVIGVAVPWLAIQLERTRFFSASTQYEPLNAVAIGLLVLALGKAMHGNLFLAAFSAGITVATFGPRQREASWQGWVFALIALVVARPLALAVSFLRSGLGAREQLAAMWFGPKGFASVVYGLIVLEYGVPGADEVFHLVALTIVMSIIAHSSSDIVVARSFKDVDMLPDPPREGLPGH